jgi:hypothetical protein
LSQAAAALCVSKDAVHRVWKEAGLKPHCLERYMASDRPDLPARNPVAVCGADTATGRVHGKTAARHTSRDFVVFLKEVVALCPPDQQIHSS